ncbi:MAG: hypothetical protein CMM53_09800 [Rhodospirillaceae bacterium]|nr:hypothetical protein [Rhodospirillaceae bacterium]
MSNSSSSKPRDIILAHSSDIHIDDGYTARANEGDGTKPLQDVLKTAENVKADVVLLAGDIFEHNRLDNKIIEKTANVIATFSMAVVVLPGNHDPAISGSPWHHRSMIKNDKLFILGVTDKTAVLFKEFDLEIWGKAHRDYEDMKPLSNPRRRKSRWQVAMAHGHYEPVIAGNSMFRPSWLFSDKDISATKADYVALGHWNRAEKVGDGSVLAYYSGSPDYAQTANIVRLSKNGRVRVRRQKILT